MAGCGSRAARPAPGNGTSPVNAMAWVTAVVEVEREMTKRGALKWEAAAWLGRRSSLGMAAGPAAGLAALLAMGEALGSRAALQVSRNALPYAASAAPHIAPLFLAPRRTHHNK